MWILQLIVNIYELDTIKVQYYNLNRNYEISEVIVTSNILVSNILAIHIVIARW